MITAWEFVNDPERLWVLYLSLFDGVGSVPQVHPVEQEALNQITQEMLALKLAKPVVANVRDNGSIDINTEISRFGWWVIKPSWEHAA